MPAGQVGEMNIKQMGAQGNGISDDTAVINQAISALIQNNGGTVYFPPGIYIISSSLVMTGANNVMFRGSGAACTQIVRASGFAGGTFSSLTGIVRVRDISLPDFTVQGSNTPPAVPASTTPLTNPFPFDCNVTITGGTVTVIAINGTATGVTSGSFVVKAGETITITYSVVPTWTWFGIGG